MASDIRTFLVTLVFIRIKEKDITEQTKIFYVDDLNTCELHLWIAIPVKAKVFEFEFKNVDLP